MRKKSLIALNLVNQAKHFDSVVGNPGAELHLRGRAVEVALVTQVHLTVFGLEKMLKIQCETEVVMGTRHAGNVLMK